MTFVGKQYWLDCGYRKQNEPMWPPEGPAVGYREKVGEGCWGRGVYKVTPGVSVCVPVCLRGGGGRGKGKRGEPKDRGMREKVILVYKGEVFGV